MSVKLLTKHHLKFLRLKGGCTGSSEYTLVKMPHCWKSHDTAQIFMITWPKMAATPIRQNSFENILPWNQKTNGIGAWYAALGM